MMLFDKMKYLNFKNWRYEDMCGKICGLIRFVLCGVAFGAVLGFIGIYLMENDRRFRRGAKKVCQKVEDFTHEVQARFSKPEIEVE